MCFPIPFAWTRSDLTGWTCQPEAIFTLLVKDRFHVDIVYSPQCLASNIQQCTMPWAFPRSICWITLPVFHSKWGSWLRFPSFSDQVCSLNPCPRYYTWTEISSILRVWHFQMIFWAAGFLRILLPWLAGAYMGPPANYSQLQNFDMWCNGYSAS